MMPDDHDSLEARLRALRPAALPAPLMNRLLAVEPPPVRHRSLRRLTLAGSFGVTAAILLMVAMAAVRRNHPPAQAGATKPAFAADAAADYRVYVPADQRSTLLGVSEGEIVDAGAERQVRLVRAVWLDDTTYVGEDQSILHRRTTRTEVVPVALETF